MDLIILVFLIYYIGKMAQQQSLNVLRWRTRLAVAWIIADLVVAGASWYITNSFTTASVSGFLAAILAALIVFQAFRREAAEQRRSHDEEKEDNL
ncbi:MAG TPA: hypothetical protein VFL76_03635 [Edaphocola sp.]|nr:hypothetical protein [Edaphocola sp.]